MIRSIPAVIVAVIVACATCLMLRAEDTTDAEQPISEADFRYAYLKLCAELDGEQGMSAMKTIVRFSQQCPVAEVVISPDTTPWLSGKSAPQYGELLLAAYIAGNVLAQLDSGVKGSDAYSGAIQVFRVYRLLQRKHPEYVVKEIEDSLAKHRDGKLIAELSQLSRKPAKK